MVNNLIYKLSVTWRISPMWNGVVLLPNYSIQFLSDALNLQIHLKNGL